MELRGKSMIKRKPKYILIQNNLNKIYYAKLYSNEIYFENILRSLRAIPTEKMCNNIVNEIKIEVNENLYSGNRINIFDLCVVEPRIKGEFFGPDDVYDPLRHCFGLSILERDEYKKLCSHSKQKLRKINIRNI